MSGARTSDAMIDVEDLGVEIARRRGAPVRILQGVSFQVDSGEMHGLVGETGSGKSMTARAIMGLLPDGGRVTGGHIAVDGHEVVAWNEGQMRTIRGSLIGMVFQSPRAALYPLRTVGAQMDAVLRAHHAYRAGERRQRIRDTLRLVGIRDPKRVAHAYPHQLSGGMAQRAVIAVVLITEPRILIADEPTTGLDATVQRQILELIASLQGRLGLSVLMITHDLAVVAQYCRTVTVMHEGRAVEQGLIQDLLTVPQNPYTQRLLEASKLTSVGEARRAVSR